MRYYPRRSHYAQSTDLSSPWQTETPLSDVTSLATLASQIEKLDLPSQAGSVLSSVPGATSTESTRSEEERSKAWALLLACGYGGDGESPTARFVSSPRLCIEQALS